jgi:hypothetical protein
VGYGVVNTDEKTVEINSNATTVKVDTKNTDIVEVEGDETCPE